MKTKKSENTNGEVIGKASGLNNYWIFAAAAGIIALSYGFDYAMDHVIGDPRVYDKEKPYFQIDNFLNEGEIEELKKFAFSNQRFLTGKEAFTDGVGHMGEAIAPDKDGKCPKDPELYLSDGQCIVPGRYDIGRHYFLTGGLNGMKETYEKLMSSLWSYYQILPKYFIDTNPLFKKMFNKPEYKRAMNTLCEAEGDSEYYFRPLQVNIVVVTPGQDLPLHYDNGWFWGANRFTMPDYLTVAMTTSGLFEDIRIRQAQSVVYLHGTEEEPYFKHGGDYKFWPKGPGGEMKTIRSKRGNAIIMDGGLVPHGGGRIAENHKVVNHGKKDWFHHLEYQGNDTWYLMVRENEENDHIIDKLTTDQLRLSFVWRGLCFKNKEEAMGYENFPTIPLEDILMKFEMDMRKRGVIKAGAPRPDAARFALLIVDTYIHMPASNVHNKMKFNYCIISKKFPFMKPILAPFCTDVDEFTSINDEVPPAKKYCAKDGKPSTNCPENSSTLEYNKV